MSEFVAQQKKINEDIASGTFAPVYFLFGTQAYLRNQNRDKLIRAMTGEEDVSGSMNFSRHGGAGFSVNEVLADAATLPFLSECRVILLEDTPLFGKGEADAEALTEALPTLPETTHLIICEEKPDKRKRLYKTLAKEGVLLDCDAVGPEEKKRWIAGRFRDAGVKLTEKDLELFSSYAGEDMLGMLSEAEKLISYVSDRPEAQRIIDAKTIRLLMRAPLQDRIFDMIDASIRGRQEEAMQIYTDLLALQTAPQAILSLLSRQYAQLLQCREMAEEHSDKEIADAIGVKQPYVVTKKIKPLAKKIPARDLKAMLERILQTDTDYKSGKIDARLAVEMLLAGA